MFNDDIERNTVYSRVDTLAQRNRLVGYAWASLKEAFYGEHADSLLIVDYDLLVQAPKNVLSLIYNLSGSPSLSMILKTFNSMLRNFDSALGLHGMHKVRPKISVEVRHTILPPDLFDQYSQLSFWKDMTGSRANVVTVQRSKSDPP